MKEEEEEEMMMMNDDKGACYLWWYLKNNLELKKILDSFDDFDNGRLNSYNFHYFQHSY